MRQTRTRLGVCWALLLFAAGLVVPASLAAAPGAVPQAGNWEGVGDHRLPLSFSLVNRGGRLLATSIAVGAPLACPAQERDAEAVPLSRTRYSGPGGTSSPADGSSVLSGRVPGGQLAHLMGRFTSSGSGTFSLAVISTVGCGWPTRTLVWQVHRARRKRLRDGLWKAALAGPGITSGRVVLTLAGHGRVIRSFRAAYTCESANVRGKGGFAASPAYEFVRPSGRFYSPLHGNPLRGHRTLWSGRFTSGGRLTGALSIYDTCAGRVVRLRFGR